MVSKKGKFKIRSMRVNVLLNMLYTLMNTIFPLITYPYVSRVLNPLGIGKVNFFLQIASYCIMFASLGIWTYGVRAVAETRDSEVDLSKTVRELLNINIILTIIVLLVYLIMSFFISQFKSNIILILINGLAIATNPFSLDWLYSGLEQYDYITKRDFFFKIVSIICIFAFVKTQSNYYVYALILTGANVGSTVFNFSYALKIIDFKSKINLNYHKHLKPMITLFASGLAVSVYFSLDTIMLGFIRGNREVGLYTTATKVEAALLAVVNAISVALLPRLSAYVQQKRYREFNIVLKQSISVISIITLSLCFFFIIAAKQCILILGGNSFLGATLSMQLLMPILVISGFSNITGNQILIPKGKDMCFTIAVSVGAVMDIIINFMVMKRFGATGASFATLIAEITQMSIQLFYARKDVFKNSDYLSIMKAIFSVIISSIVLLITKSYFENLPLLVGLVVEAMVFFTFVLLLLLFLKEKNICKLAKDVISYLH